jgi:hypothetical protein
MLNEIRSGERVVKCSNNELFEEITLISVIMLTTFITFNYNSDQLGTPAFRENYLLL